RQEFIFDRSLEKTAAADALELDFRQIFFIFCTVVEMSFISIPRFETTNMECSRKYLIMTKDSS
ncbi:MAG: hypothetical protein DWH91_04780, partial [Planctomycetota bacterium]